MRAGDDVCADHFAVLLSSVCPSVDCGLDGGDVTRDARAHEHAANAFEGAGELYVRCLEHSVHTGGEGDESFGFEESDSLLCHNFQGV